MDIEQIKDRFYAALNELYETDNHLLVHNTSEQSISHKLAEHLQRRFNGYDVDCEYNGNVDDMDGRKRVFYLKQDLRDYGFIRLREENDEENDIAQRSVFPDIIIHRRASNDDNLLIVEVKKDVSNVDIRYDELKVKAYTSNLHGNTLNYSCGIFICVGTRDNFPNCRISYFTEGNLISLEEYNHHAGSITELDHDGHVQGL